MSELLYNKSKAVEELNKVEGFYPLELARVISNEGQEEQRYLDVKYSYHLSGLIIIHHNKKTCQGCVFALYCSKSLTGIFIMIF